jgi:hypothetical protein
MSETPASTDRPAPLVGEHTRDILAEFGFSAREIDGFLASGAAAQATESEDVSERRAGVAAA